MTWTRRHFIAAGGASLATAFVGLKHAMATDQLDGHESVFGPLRRDPRKILDLPAAFDYRIVSSAGQEMSDGLLVPGFPDGMAAFAAADGRIRLIRNHELDPRRARADGSPFGPDCGRFSEQLRPRLYDAGGRVPLSGGTTTVEIDPRSGRTIRQWLSLAGTERNCAGGTTPWGSWLSCEESDSRADRHHGRDHGFVFEVPAAANALVDPLPLTAMGRFNHEAAAVDPRSGVVYLSEDRKDGLLYRFVPHQRTKLHQGGVLQALVLSAWLEADTRNWSTRKTTWDLNQRFSVRWVTLSDVESPDDTLRHQGRSMGAAIFARGEGLWFGDGALYFACTSGGAQKAGQIFKYHPSPDEGQQRQTAQPAQMTLFVESDNADVLANCDNLTVSPWGDLIVCEDSKRSCGLVGVTASGQCYRFAHNPYNGSELAGACFAPDGKTLFVNLQETGLTLAINGPFPGQ